MLRDDCREASGFLWKGLETCCSRCRSSCLQQTSRAVKTNIPGWWGKPGGSELWCLETKELWKLHTSPFCPVHTFLLDKALLPPQKGLFSFQIIPLPFFWVWRNQMFVNTCPRWVRKVLHSSIQTGRYIHTYTHAIQIDVENEWEKTRY